MVRKKTSLRNELTLSSTDIEVQSEHQAQVSLVAPLDSILPDPGQPRRLLPADLTDAVSKGSLAPLDALQEWLHRGESDTAEPALRHHIRELRRLADSIEQHGLISPISVRFPQPDETVPPGVIYFIVTGERRYWAHLYLLSQDKQIHAGQVIASPHEIKITLAPLGITIRAHQLIENLLREDINAIERPRDVGAAL